MTFHRVLGSLVAAAAVLMMAGPTLLLYAHDGVASPAFQTLMWIGIPGLLILAFAGTGALGFGLWLAASPDDALHHAHRVVAGLRNQRVLDD